MEVETGFEPVYAALQAATSPLGHSTKTPAKPGWVADMRADDGIRTRDPHLGKVMRYQLRYVRIRPEKVFAISGRKGTISDEGSDVA